MSNKIILDPAVRNYLLLTARVTQDETPEFAEQIKMLLEPMYSAPQPDIDAQYTAADMASQAAQGFRDGQRGVGAYMELLQDLTEFIDVPEKNCSCHLSPPCGDCVEYAGIRETIESANQILAEYKLQQAEP